MFCLACSLSAFYTKNIKAHVLLHYKIFICKSSYTSWIGYTKERLVSVSAFIPDGWSTFSEK